MLNPADINSTIYNMGDFNLNKLEDNIKALKKANKDDEKLMKTAGEFEAIFVKKLIDVMDSTVDKSGFISGGRGEETFKSMLNQEIALKISSNPSTSLGMAKQVYEQMKRQS